MNIGPRGLGWNLLLSEMIICLLIGAENLLYECTWANS